MYFKQMNEQGVAFFERWESFKENVKIAPLEQSSEISYQTRAWERHLEGNSEYLCQLECQWPAAKIQHLNYMKTQPHHISQERFRGPAVRARVVQCISRVFSFSIVRFSLEYLSTLSRKWFLSDLREIMLSAPLYRTITDRGRVVFGLRGWCSI